MTPENRKLVLGFGVVLLVGVGVSLKTGVTYFRGTVHRDETPGDFWTSVVCMLVLGIFLTTGAIVAD